MNSVKQVRKFDILLSGGTLLTMSPSMEIIEDSVVGISNGRFSLVASRKDCPLETLDDVEMIDAEGCILLPGLVNTHTHLPMTAFRGMADDLPLMTWLQEYIFPAEARYVNREMVYTTSMLGIAEMILSGTTTFGDGYFFESSVIQAAIDAGMRGVAGMGFIDYPAPGRSDPSGHGPAAEKFLDRWLGYSPMITPALFCHAPYTCSTETITLIKNLAHQAGVPFMIHLSETEEEVGIIRHRYGSLPVHHLQSIHALDERTIAIHCNWLTDEEIDILANLHVKVSHNPESNMKLATGMARIPLMLEKRITVGLGTDGCASNNDMDLFHEMDTAAKVHKLIERNPTVMDAPAVLKMATIEGARVLGLEKEIGSIEVGKHADLIAVDIDSPHLTPLYNPYSHLVYAACGADVVLSIIGGRIIMRDRKLLTADLQAIQTEVQKLALTIKADHKSHFKERISS
jgi:5-methylthioadenosine/S-adenosylhomocysteine deaminase